MTVEIVREFPFQANTGVDGTATFTYRPSEPFAVVVTFRPKPDAQTQWQPVRLRLWRDHLASGTTAYPGSPAVVRDVRIWSDPRYLLIRYDTDDGFLIVSTRVAAVRRFLRETADLVEPGAEHVPALPQWIYRDGA